MLWSSTEVSDWTAGGGGGEVYPTYAKCRARITQITHMAEEGSLADWTQWLMSTGPYDPKHPPYAIDFVGAYRMRGGVAVTDGKHYSEWKCLPETMDPRGPKGR